MGISLSYKWHLPTNISHKIHGQIISTLPAVVLTRFILDDWSVLYLKLLKQELYQGEINYW